MKLMVDSSLKDLLKKIFDHFGLEEITLTFIPYLIILGILLVIFFARGYIHEKEIHVVNDFGGIFIVPMGSGCAFISGGTS